MKFKNDYKRVFQYKNFNWNLKLWKITVSNRFNNNMLPTFVILSGETKNETSYRTGTTEQNETEIFANRASKYLILDGSLSFVNKLISLDDWLFILVFDPNYDYFLELNFLIFD